jgi:hypothetical protein
MDEATEIALRKSIEKWEQIVAGTGIDKGKYNCALCLKFAYFNPCDPKRPAENNVESLSCCKGCPVDDVSNLGCGDTPYDDWENDDTRENAQAELDFLKSLLPVKT